MTVLNNLNSVVLLKDSLLVITAITSNQAIKHSEITDIRESCPQIKDYLKNRN